MNASEQTWRATLSECTVPELIELGTAMLNLVAGKRETGVLELDAPATDVKFRPDEKIMKFSSVVDVLRRYVPYKECFDREALRGLNHSQVIAKWCLIINKFLAQKLNEVAALREQEEDPNSSRAHKKGAAIIASLEYPIKSGAEAQNIKGIGPKMAVKIDLLLANGDLDELVVVANREKVIKTLSFWGSGTVTATTWYNMGARSVQDVINMDADGRIKLTKMQRIAAEHYDDFGVELTSRDADHIVNLVRASVPYGFEVVKVGSFRRGRTKSKDCDVLVIGDPKNTSTSATILTNLEQIADVAIASLGPHVFMGVIKMPTGVWKRFDVFVASEDERGCSLLAHTGPALYNIKLRAAAAEKGWLLNERTLSDEHGEIIPTPTEADVQRALNFPVLKPSDRK